MEEQDDVPIRVQQPCLAPQIRLVYRLVGKLEALFLEARDAPVEIVALEADLGQGPWKRVPGFRDLDRERSSPLRQFEAGVVGRVPDVLLEAESALEIDRAVEVADRDHDVVEAHRFTVADRGREGKSRSSRGEPAPIVDLPAAVPTTGLKLLR